jgi:iron complex outermembrane receptor protein
LLAVLGSTGPGAAPAAEGEVAAQEAVAGQVERTVVEQGEQGDGHDAERTLLARTPGFATVVELEHERGAQPQDGLPEVLNRVPSTTVRSLGGLGQFAAVSIRGSSAQQVRVSLDGVPLDGASTASLDLASMPLDGLGRVEVHRGFIPIEYGGAAIGGVINLVGEGVATDNELRVWSGVGSFGSREAGTSLALPLGERHSLRARVGYGSSQGSFSFFDDGNTPAVPDDDALVVRKNNDYERLNSSLRWDARRGRVRWSLQQIGGVREQGVPGVGAAQATASRLSTLDTRTLAKIERRSFWAPGGTLGWLASMGWSQRSFADPGGEVGLGIDDQRTRASDVYLSPRMRLPAWKGAFIKLTADARGEWVDVEEAADATSTRSGDSQRRRASMGAGVELEQFLAERRVQLVLGLRTDALVNRFAVAPGEGEADESGEDSTGLGFTPRLGIRARLVEGLSLRMSAGRYFRPPTLMELFGDQGYVLGREDLVPETGANFDLGFVLDREVGPRGKTWGLMAQVAAYGSFTDDLISWVQAGPVVRPTNIEGARVVGLESGAQFQAPERLVIVQANYTFADAVNLSEVSSQNGQPLPGRPRHQAFVRLSVGKRFGYREHWEPRAFYGIDYSASSYLDPSGRLSLPPRHFHHVGVEAHVLEGIDLAFEVRNLLDQRQVSWQPPIAGEAPVPTAIVDFIGYPLPGRSLWASLRVRW